MRAKLTYVLLLLIIFQLGCVANKHVNEKLQFLINKVESDSLFLDYKQKCFKNFSNKYKIVNKYLFSHNILYSTRKDFYEEYFNGFIDNNKSFYENLKKLTLIDSIRAENFERINLSSNLTEISSDSSNYFLNIDFVSDSLWYIEIESTECIYEGRYFIFKLDNKNKIHLINKGHYNY